MHGYDFYFAVMNGGQVKSVEQVRLYGPSDVFLESRRDVYRKDGFTLRPSTKEEYRAKNWEKRKCA